MPTVTLNIKEKDGETYAFDFESTQKNMVPLQQAKKAEKAEKAGTIVDVAVGNPNFSTLVAALKAANLVTTLQGAGPFTVFAPTNAAFKALPSGVLDALLRPENKATLVKILTYHVVPGKVLAADIEYGDVQTVEGSTVMLKVCPKDGLKVNKAKVIITDVMAVNGVIHAIDAVLLPKDVTLPKKM